MERSRLDINKMNDKKLSITITTGTIIKALAVFGIVFSCI